MRGAFGRGADDAGALAAPGEAAENAADALAGAAGLTTDSMPDAAPVGAVGLVALPVALTAAARLAALDGGDGSGRKGVALSVLTADVSELGAEAGGSENSVQATAIAIAPAHATSRATRNPDCFGWNGGMVESVRGAGGSAASAAIAGTSSLSGGGDGARGVCGSGDCGGGAGDWARGAGERGGGAGVMSTSTAGGSDADAAGGGRSDAAFQSSSASSLSCSLKGSGSFGGAAAFCAAAAAAAASRMRSRFDLGNATSGVLRCSGSCVSARRASSRSSLGRIVGRWDSVFATAGVSGSGGNGGSLLMSKLAASLGRRGAARLDGAMSSGLFDSGCGALPPGRGTLPPGLGAPLPSVSEPSAARPGEERGGDDEGLPGSFGAGFASAAGLGPDAAAAFFFASGSERKPARSDMKSSNSSRLPPAAGDAPGAAGLPAGGLLRSPSAIRPRCPRVPPDHRSRQANYVMEKLEVHNISACSAPLRGCAAQGSILCPAPAVGDKGAGVSEPKATSSTGGAPAADGRWVQPAEWAPHEACWVAWPSDGELWQESLAPAQNAFACMCDAIAGGGPGGEAPGAERLEVLVPDQAREDEARRAVRALRGPGARVHRIPFGDIWLRDIAPIFVAGDEGVAATTFGFNGWGGKYVLEHDEAVAGRIAAASGLPVRSFPWVFEGGSVDVDGEGTCLTTRQCLLNPNRNPGMDREAVERGLCEAIGADEVLWLERGLANDHTDGHVDTLARFVAAGVVVCMEPRAGDDPNTEALREIARDLSAMTDVRGRRLEVVRIPSPGRISSAKGEVMPASYVNFYIGNRAVVVPTYGSPYDDEAVRRIGELFPGRATVGVDARAILTGGGAFHCITQQQPRQPRARPA